MIAIMHWLKRIIIVQKLTSRMEFWALVDCHCLSIFSLHVIFFHCMSIFSSLRDALGHNNDVATCCVLSASLHTPEQVWRCVSCGRWSWAIHWGAIAQCPLSATIRLHPEPPLFWWGPSGTPWRRWAHSNTPEEGRVKNGGLGWGEEGRVWSWPTSPSPFSAK